MFTLGNKEAIVNSTSKYPITISGTTMKIEGYGEFEQSQITNAFGQRFIAARSAGMNLTAMSGADLGIPTGTVNVPVSISIIVNTFRDESEWSNNYIKKGRPFIFEILIGGSDTDIIVAGKLVAAMQQYEANYVYSDKGLPFTFSNTGAVILLETKEGSLEFRNRVEFAVDKQIKPYVASTSRFIYKTNDVASTSALTTVLLTTLNGILLGDTISINGDERVVISIDIASTSIVVNAAISVTIGDLVLVKSIAIEGNYLGKYLEENVRMSLKSTSDSYGISPDEKPIIAGKYTTISFETSDAGLNSINTAYKRHKGLGRTRGESVGARKAKFTLYILEGSDMFVDNGSVEQLADFLLPKTNAEEKFRVYNGAAVGTGELFRTNG